MKEDILLSMKSRRRNSSYRFLYRIYDLTDAPPLIPAPLTDKSQTDSFKNFGCGHKKVKC